MKCPGGDAGLLNNGLTRFAYPMGLVQRSCSGHPPKQQWSTQPPKEAEWTCHKSRIERLYLNEGKKLREVMEIMAREHGFKASIKMYKSRLTRWGFDRKYKKRQASGSTNAGSEQLSQDTSSAEEIELPHQNPIIVAPPPTIQHLQLSGKSDAVRDDLRRHVRYFLTSYVAEDLPFKPSCSVTWEKARQDVAEVKSHLMLAFMTIGDHDSPGSTAHFMNKATSSIKDLTKAGCPYAIPELFELSFWLIKEKRYETVVMIFRHLFEISAEYSTMGQHVYRILAEENRNGVNGFRKAALEVGRVLAVTSEKVINMITPEISLSLQLSHLTRLAEFCACEGPELSLCDCAAESERSMRELLDPTRICLCSNYCFCFQLTRKALADVLLIKRRYVEAERIGEEILLTEPHVSLDCTLGREALRLVAEAQYAQGKLTAALDTWKALVSLHDTLWPTIDVSQTEKIIYKARLEACLRKLNRTEEAELIRADRARWIAAQEQSTWVLPTALLSPFDMFSEGAEDMLKP